MQRVMAIVIALLATGIVYAQPGPRAPRAEGRMQYHEDMMGMLNLTPDQEKKFDDARVELQRTMVKNRSAVRLAQIDLEQLMNADNPDRNAIGKKMKEISDLEYQQKLAGVDHMFTIRGMLTPEQLELWKEHHRGDGPGWGMGRQGSCACGMCGDDEFGRKGPFRESPPED